MTRKPIRTQGSRDRRATCNRVFVYCDYGKGVLSWKKVEGGKEEDMQLLNGNEVITPTKDDAALAEESGRVLAAHLADDARG